MAQRGPARPKDGTRRRPGEVREALVSAASELFAANGYARTTTRDVAAAAGVADSQLFRHFATKADLFHAAVVDPFREYFIDYRLKWEKQLSEPVGTEELIRIFVEGFYDFVRERRDLVLALVEATEFDADAVGQMDFGLGELLAEHERVIAAEVEPRHLSGLDVPVTTRASVSMIIAMAVLDSWLFPRGARKPGRRRIIDEMVSLLHYGVAGRPAQ